ncbi:MAG TPA: outer membrane protein [Pseudolabrys sp.]
MRQSTKLCVLSALFGLTSIASASAADIAAPVYKAPYNPAPVYSWTGLYLGAHAGGGWNKMSGSGTFSAGDTVTAQGPLGGFQLGYNYQLGQFVVGVEGEYSFANVKYSTGLFAGSLNYKNDQYATVAARLGYAFDRTLVYGKIGGAWTHEKWDGTDGTGGTVTGSYSRRGLMLGAGVEYAFLNNWSAKLEYNYLNFPSLIPSFTTTGTLTVLGTANVSLVTHVVKAGINYHFNAL